MSVAEIAHAVLTYWDGRGNAEIIRLMLAVTGEQWTEGVFGDESESHVSKQEQMKVMSNAGVLGFDQIDGMNIVQKMAAVRYLARKHKMYGADETETVQCDIIAECYNDWKMALKSNDNGESFGIALKKFMPRFQRFIDSNNTKSGFFVGKTVTFVDVLVFQLMHDSLEMRDEHGQARFHYAQWPRLEEHHRLMLSSIPGLAAYLASDRRYPSPGREGYFDRVKATIPWVFGEGPAPEMTAPIWNFGSHITK